MNKKLPPNYCIDSGIFTLNQSPKLKVGDEVYTDFFDRGDRKIYVVTYFKKKADTGSRCAVQLKQEVCSKCGRGGLETGLIDAAWAIPIKAKIHDKESE